jgi:hypothetical protein
MKRLEKTNPDIFMASILWQAFYCSFFNAAVLGLPFYDKLFKAAFL